MSEDEDNRALREQVAKLLLENALSFITVVSPENRLLATGRTPSGFGSVVGKSVFEFTEPASHDVLREALDRVRATGEAVQYEVTGYGEDGEPGHVYRTRALPMRAGDRVVNVLLLATDITDRVRLERSLVESQRALRLALETSRVGVWRWDVAKDEIEWDRRLLEIWGLTETPPDYDAYLLGIHPDDRERVAEIVKEAVETGEFPAFEHRLAPRPDGSVRWVLASGGTLRDERGKPSLLMGVVLDVTEQRELQAQMQRAARVEAIGQLTAGIAHNFNNLLAAIIPNVEIAMKVAVEREREALSVALDASLQARELVRSLLALARRTPAIDRGPSDPARVASAVEAMCRATFPREIALVCDIAGGLGSVPMPASELEQALLNLMFNARDALDGATGERRITIAIARVTIDGAPWVQLRVSDTGPGMSEDVRNRLGEPFFTTKPPHKGSGLGLANAFARVREAGGRIDCDSAPGRGATFTIAFPEAAPPAAAGTPAIESGPRGHGTLLLVDDEQLVRSAVRQVLEDDGYTVVEAASASEARDALDRAGGEVRLVILDQSMPAESGLAAIPSIRARTSAPVVLFTGLRPEGIPEDVAVLEKPARPGEIRRVVRELLRERRTP